MSTISLRRTKFHKVDGKNLVELPAKTVYIQKIKLSKEERDLYNMFKNEGHAILERYFYYFKECVSVVSLRVIS